MGEMIYTYTENCMKYLKIKVGMKKDDDHGICEILNYSVVEREIGKKRKNRMIYGLTAFLEDLMEI